jgi:hypothetical protein
MKQDKEQNVSEAFQKESLKRGAFTLGFKVEVVRRRLAWHLSSIACGEMFDVLRQFIHLATGNRPYALYQPA